MPTLLWVLVELTGPREQDARLPEQVERELALLIEASRELAELESRLHAIVGELEAAEQRRTEHDRAIGALEGRRRELEAQRARSTETLAHVSADDQAAVDRSAAALRERQIDRLDAVHDVVESLRAELIAQSDGVSNRLRLATTRTERAMDAFRRDHPTETTELDSSIEAAAALSTLFRSL